MEREKVTITLSIAKEAREGYNPGDKPHGKHASTNVGISIMRADRELDLQRKGWTTSYNPVERWWGAEIDFPPSLDEVFGVPNNKQGAFSLEDVGTLSLEDIAEREGFNDQFEMEEAWKNDGDPRLLLIKIKRYIESNLSSIRSSLKRQTEGSNSKKRDMEILLTHSLQKMLELKRRGGGLRMVINQNPTKMKRSLSLRDYKKLNLALPLMA